ncbi:unnamed protein product [Durusdinium trenchii]|uniref:Uncharacterized protein n=1 Tax=Durusdinium trenchii TaxID=1381693 RepID=A0ABP0P1A0_9DINO
MILTNFLKDPNSERNRKVNTSGARFSEIFRNNSAAGELLKLAGFQYQHPNFVYGNENGINTDGAQRTLDLVQEAQRNIDQTWSNRAAASSSPATPATASAATVNPVTPAAASTAASASNPEAARPWARTQPPPGAPAAWVSMTRDINEDPPTAPLAAATPAHPAETLPPAIAHPAESEARPAAPQVAPQPQVQAPQPSQPQMHLPIAHPAEAAPAGSPDHRWKVERYCQKIQEIRHQVWQQLLYICSLFFLQDVAAFTKLLLVFTAGRAQETVLVLIHHRSPSRTSHLCRG